MNPHRDREKNMETLIKTAITFLSRSKTMSDEMMTIGVGLIADMVNVDLFSIWRNVSTQNTILTSQIYRWAREEGGMTSPLPNLQNVAYHQFGLPLEEFFSRGDSINNVASQFSDDSILKSLGIQSVLVTPIFISNTLWGFALCGDSFYERHFDDMIVEMMGSTAFLLANTVIRNEMESELTGQSELNRALFDSAPIGLTIFDERGSIKDCNDAILSICDVTKEYHLEFFEDLFPAYQPDGTKSREKMHECMQRALAGERIVMEWMFCSPTGELIPCEMTLLRVKHNGRYLGLGYSYDLRNIKNMEADIKRLESSAAQIYDDPLTGINNRRLFDENLKRFLKSLSRTGGMLSLLLIDIDYFKDYNDTYGHIEGDRCLKMVAKTLAKSVKRVDDFVARYGGEEFVVVLPNTDATGAKVAAEKIRQSIEQCNIPHKASKTSDHVTISIGGTTGRVERTHAPEDFIKRADEMLYFSKHHGRNQCSFCLLNEETQKTDANTYPH